MIAEEARQERHTRYSFGHFLPKVVRRVPQSHHSDPLSTLHKQTAVTLPEIEVHKLSSEKHEKKNKTSRVNLPQNPEKERLRHCQVEKQVKKSGGQWWDWPERKRRTGMPNHSSFVKPGAEAVVGSHSRGHCHGHNLPPLPHGVETVPTHIQPQAQRKLDPIKLGMPTFSHRVMHTLITTVMHAEFVSGYTNIYVSSHRYEYPQSTCAPHPHTSAWAISSSAPPPCSLCWPQQSPLPHSTSHSQGLTTQPPSSTLTPSSTPHLPPSYTSNTLNTQQQNALPSIPAANHVFPW